MASAPEEDRDAPHETQARGDRRQAAPSGRPGLARADRRRRGALDRRDRGDLLLLAPGVWRAQDRPGQAAEGARGRERAPAAGGGGPDPGQADPQGGGLGKLLLYPGRMTQAPYFLLQGAVGARSARLSLLSEVGRRAAVMMGSEGRAEPSEPRGRRERRTSFRGLARSRRPRGDAPSVVEEPRLDDGLGQAAAVQRKSVPSRHMRWSAMPSWGATATIARRIPRRLATATPQAFSGFQRPGPVRRTSAASYRLERIIASPQREIRPTLAVSPDWWRRGMSPWWAPTHLERENRAGLSTQVRKVGATTGPTPGAVIRRRQTGSARASSSSMRCSLSNWARGAGRASRSGPTIAATIGCPASSSRMRPSNLAAPTMPTLSPKVRSDPRKSFSRSWILRWSSLRGVRRRRCWL